MDPFYYSFNNYLKTRFQSRVRRISLNAGFGCPHRDEKLGLKGCFYCNESGFVSYKDIKLSLVEQIETSMAIFKKQFKADKFIAYFQNASNTYAPVEDLKQIYDVIKQFDQIIGLAISTRPDCIDDQKLKLIDSYCGQYEVWLEYGLQSIHIQTLELLNRQHTMQDFLDAVAKTAKTRIKIAAHVMLGIPGESRQDMIATALSLARLPIQAVKVHIFHILKNTRFAEIYEQEQFKLISEPEYVRIACDFLEHLKPDCAIMRLVSESSQELLIAPLWMNQKQKILHAIGNEFQKRGTHQGSYWGKNK
ncbi:MAG: TIGR01212 family radical SAM protein [Candidatus Omnitrophica bacterium]|nr:TIGR01212 family radical SAM protein [Candidatus Omnitrophota bacterium]